MKKGPTTISGQAGRHIIVCCGSGGVGKTTVSAALALQAALVGRKTLVLTIDPAKRLSDALGLKGLGYDEQRVPAGKFTEQGLHPAGELYAMMLDTKRTFDQLIAKVASSDTMRDNILNNWYYQHISGALAGTHEYMAMEKLFDIHQQDKYELIVVDTPPSRRALDFLEAPERLTSLLADHPLWKLVAPSLRAGRWGIQFFTALASPVLRTASQVLGAKMLQDIEDFFRLADETFFVGFRQRAAAVRQLLRSPHTLFFAITSPRRAPLQEALFLFNRLHEYHMPFGGFIVNRTHPTYPIGKGAQRTHRRIAAAQGIPDSLMNKLIANFSEYNKLAESDEEAVADLVREVGPDVQVRRIPDFDQDLHDFAGLLEMGVYL